MFNARELKMLERALAAAMDLWGDTHFQELYAKIVFAHRHQELHEIMQEFLGVSRSYMVDIGDLPVPKSMQIPEGAKFVVHQGPNYNRPEDRSGVQSEKLRRLMPRFIPIKPSDITYGDITTEAMNRILRTINDKEMG